MEPIIEIINGVPRHPSYRMNEPVNFVMNPGEQIALVGPNGAGKSRLVDILIGRWPLLMNEVKYHFPSSTSEMVCDNIKYITFRDSYGDSDGTFYYQQRWNSQDMETTPLVRELLPEISDVAFHELLYFLFGLEEFMDKHIVLLSSGELRKFQLAKALMSKPSVLILDNPFIGLDAPTRVLLRNLLEKMIQMMHLHVILVLSREDEIPSFITHDSPSKSWNDAIFAPVEGSPGKMKHHRTCTWMKFKRKADGKVFFYYNTHLEFGYHANYNLGQTAREKGVALVVERMKAKVTNGEALIFGGDMNQVANDKCFNPLFDNGFVSGRVTATTVTSEQNRNSITWNDYEASSRDKQENNNYSPNSWNMIDHFFLKNCNAMEFRTIQWGMSIILSG